MPNYEFELDEKGVRELLRSPEMATVLASFGNPVRNRAGKGFRSDERDTGQRRVFTVTAVTQAAKSKNLKDNTLLKALGGGI